MSTTLTVRLSAKEAKSLDAICRMTGKSRSEVVRESLRGYEVRRSLAAIRDELVPKARDAGWLTEEDVFRDVS